MEKALEANRERLLAVPGVVGVGLGMRDGEKVIVVMCAAPAAETAARLPRRIDGSRVIVEETGPIHLR